ncbi:MAG: porin [Cellvibrionales bacterium]|nr:MAG: porin [Cellvibrionales bacterium]
MMRKTTLAVAIASALALPVSAYAVGPIDGSVYGKVNISVVNDDNGTDDQMELNSNASRIGVKGKAKLTDTLYVIYKAEYESYWDDGDKNGNTFSQRNIIGGLKGDFGTVWGGKHDTPTKMAQKKVDLFNDLEGDIKQVMAGETRASNIVNYTTPKFSGFSASVATIFGEDRSDNDKDGFFDSYSAVAQYEVDGVYVAVALDENVKSGSKSQGMGKDYVNIFRVVGQFPIGPVTLGAMWQNAEEGDSATTGMKLDEDSWHVSAKWKVGNGYTLKAQYTESDDDESDNDADMMSFGLDKKLGKKTKVFAFYTTLDKSTAADDSDWIGVGLEHKF